MTIFGLFCATLAEPLNWKLSSNGAYQAKDGGGVERFLILAPSVVDASAILEKRISR